jgi:hypothetical protein
MATDAGIGTAIRGRAATGTAPAQSVVAVNTHDIRSAVPRRTRPGLPVVIS